MTSSDRLTTAELVAPPERDDPAWPDYCRRLHLWYDDLLRRIDDMEAPELATTPYFDGYRMAGGCISEPVWDWEE